MKIRLVGAELFYADGQTDGLTEKGTDRRIWGKAKNLFSQFCESTWNW